MAKIVAEYEVIKSTREEDSYLIVCHTHGHTMCGLSKEDLGSYIVDGEYSHVDCDDEEGGSFSWCPGADGTFAVTEDGECTCTIVQAHAGCPCGVCDGLLDEEEEEA
jgi:hypothetical protein